MKPAASWRSAIPGPAWGARPPPLGAAAPRFVDSYRVDLSESVYAPNRVSVRLGLYEAEWGRLPLIQNGVAASPDQSLDVGAVDIVARPGAWPNAQFPASPTKSLLSAILRTARPARRGR
jgi:hypothetical protein